jgi:hypothetical protein
MEAHTLCGPGYSIAEYVTKLKLKMDINRIMGCIVKPLYLNFAVYTKRLK